MSRLWHIHKRSYRCIATPNNRGSHLHSATPDKGPPGPPSGAEAALMSRTHSENSMWECSQMQCTHRGSTWSQCCIILQQDCIMRTQLSRASSSPQSMHYCQGQTGRQRGVGCNIAALFTDKINSHSGGRSPSRATGRVLQILTHISAHHGIAHTSAS